MQTIVDSLRMPVPRRWRHSHQFHGPVAETDHPAHRCRLSPIHHESHPGTRSRPPKNPRPWAAHYNPERRAESPSTFPPIPPMSFEHTVHVAWPGPPDRELSRVRSYERLSEAQPDRVSTSRSSQGFSTLSSSLVVTARSDWNRPAAAFLVPNILHSVRCPSSPKYRPPSRVASDEEQGPATTPKVPGPAHGWTDWLLRRQSRTKRSSFPSRRYSASGRSLRLQPDRPRPDSSPEGTNPGLVDSRSPQRDDPRQSAHRSG